MRRSGIWTVDLQEIWEILGSNKRPPPTYVQMVFMSSWAHLSELPSWFLKGARVLEKDSKPGWQSCFGKQTLHLGSKEESLGLGTSIKMQVPYLQGSPEVTPLSFFGLFPWRWGAQSWPCQGSKSFKAGEHRQSQRVKTDLQDTVPKPKSACGLNEVKRQKMWWFAVLFLQVSPRPAALSRAVWKTLHLNLSNEFKDIQLPCIMEAVAFKRKPNLED